jgi:hypothetical protein
MNQPTRDVSTAARRPIGDNVPCLAVVIPTLNERANVPLLAKRLEEALAGCSCFMEAARRNSWGSRRVAYASQFLDPDNRAHRGKAKIKARLIGDNDPDEWDVPPKPKWMRRRTYNRFVERFDAYEDVLTRGIPELWAKLLSK